MDKWYTLESGFSGVNPKREQWFKENPVFRFEILNGCAVLKSRSGLTNWRTTSIKKFYCTPDCGYIRFVTASGTVYNITEEV